MQRPPKGAENDRNTVQVITAGGAASASSSAPQQRRGGNKNRRHRGKKKRAPQKRPPAEAAATSNSTNATSAAAVVVEEKVSAASVPAQPVVSSSSSPKHDKLQEELQNTTDDVLAEESLMTLELEEGGGESPSQADQDIVVNDVKPHGSHELKESPFPRTPYSDNAGGGPVSPPVHLYDAEPRPKKHELVWLCICFLGIMASFVCYGLLLEYTTSGGRKLHELSFLFVTSGLYTLTAATGRYVRDETPTTIPPARFAVLGLTSMGSTFCSVRSLRYVIYPIQVLAKSCKPVPVMIMGALMGKKYPPRKYANVVMIVLGVALFMGGGSSKKKSAAEDDGDDLSSSPSQIFGILLLFVSLCFDGGTGAYEDKLMSVHSVQPFDLMYNIQLGKTILAGIGLLVFNQMHIFIQMVQEMGFLLVALGLSGALGQVFIFVTIAKFGALTCSIIGLARKVTTLVASIYFYGHHLNSVQATGLVISITAMVMNFWGKKKGGGGHHGDHHGPPHQTAVAPEELEKMLDEQEDEGADVELAPATKSPNY